MREHNLRYTKYIVMLIACIFILSACKKKENYSVEVKNKTYYIDTVQNTITCDGVQYEYHMTSGSTSIIFPDGTKYTSTKRDNITTGSWSGPIDSDNSISKINLTYDLLEALEDEVPSEGINGGKVLFAILIIGAGILGLAKPDIVWYLDIGWKFKDSEPSDAALVMTRVGGLFAFIIGIIVLIAG